MTATRTFALGLSLITALAVSVPISAAVVITPAGSDLNQPDWENEGIGGLGALFFAADGATRNNDTSVAGGLASDQPGYVLGPGNATSSGGLFSGANSFDEVSLDDPTTAGTIVPGAIAVASVNDDLFKEVFTLEFDAGVPDGLTIGILVGAADPSNGGTSPDVPTLVGIREAGGTAVTQVTDKTASSTRADWYFFNVTGITDGTVLEFGGTRTSSSSPDKLVGINGVSFDVIPEPGSLALVAAGGVLLAGLRRNRA